MGDDQMIERELHDASVALVDTPARPPARVSELRTRFETRRRRRRAMATAAAALLLLGAGGGYAAIRRNGRSTATERVRTAGTASTTTVPGSSGLTAADVRALTTIIERGAQARWIGHEQVTRAEAVLTTQAKAMRVAGERTERWTGSPEMIALVEYGRFPAPSGPPRPDGSTSIRPPFSVRVSFLDPATLEGRGVTLSNRPPDLASVGTVVDVPLKLDSGGAATLPLRPPLGRAERRVNFDEASIVVPKAWTVLAPGQSSCDEHVVQVGTPGPTPTCTERSQGKPTKVTIQALPADFSTKPWPQATAVNFNGHRVIQLTPTSMGVTQGTVKYAVRDLGVELSMSGAGTEEVISSIDWSDRHVALAFAHDNAGLRTPGWRTMRYDGISFQVPPTFRPTPIRSTESTLIWCTTPVRRDAVVEGPVSSRDLPECFRSNGPVPVPEGVDGIWIRPAGDAPPLKSLGPDLSKIASGQVSVVDDTPLRVTFTDAAYLPDVVLEVTPASGKPVLLTVGLGSDPTVAGRIIASLRVD